MDFGIKKITFSLLICLCMFLLQSIFIFQTFAGENPPPQTLKEIQENIKVLEDEKKKIIPNSQDFSIGNIKIGDFFRNDLSAQELSSTMLLIDSYLSKLSLLLSNSLENKNDIIALKQDFFISLLPYIEVEKIESYKKSVGSDVFEFEKNSTVNNEIEQKNIQKEDLIRTYEQQAQKNSEVIRTQMQEKILGQIEIKLSAIANQEKFQSLPSDLKVEVFQKISDKLALKLQELQKTPNSTTVVQEKIYLYHGILELLQSYIDGWK